MPCSVSNQLIVYLVCEFQNVRWRRRLQGDDGDNFYVIDSGVYDVIITTRRSTGAGHEDDGVQGQAGAVVETAATRTTARAAR